MQVGCQYIQMVGLQESRWIKEEENKQEEEDDKSYLHSSRGIQHDSNQSTLSDFMA